MKTDGSIYVKMSKQLRVNTVNDLTICDRPSQSGVDGLAEIDQV